MIFVETSVFTSQILGLTTDERYRALQLALLLRPEQGPLIQGCGGLRKVRWPEPGSGKRGGLRIIYFWAEDEGVIYMIFAYRKARQMNLTNDQIKALRRLVKEEFK